MSIQDIRWIQRFDSFSKALENLNDGVELAKSKELSKFERQGVIKAFEFTHELAWKSLKDFLFVHGNNEIFGSRDATRESFKYGLIESGEIWMDMIVSRNKTSHIYNEDIAAEILDIILSDYCDELNKLQRKLAQLKLQEKE